MRLAVVAAVACSVIGLAFAQESQAVARKYTNIPAQGLGPALQFLAKDRDFQVIYVSEDVYGVQTAGAVGDLTFDEALTNLLAGTGLNFKYLDERTMVVGLDANDDKQPLPIVGANSTPWRGKEGALREGEGKRTSAPLRLSLAQGEESKSSKGEENTKNPESPNKDTQEQLEEIVVTGTHIRGGEVPAGSDVTVLDRVEIDKTGFATTQQVIQTLPQNFLGGANEGTVGSQEGRAFLNGSNGSGINLRGLGTDSTLTLVNGRRVARGGFGTFVDVSTIPLTAVERIEVLPEGASALYGSDAIGGVVNIIMRDDYDGAEMRARVGSVTQGDSPEYQGSLMLGRNWETGHALVAYEYYRRDNLKTADRDFVTDDLTRFGGEDFRGPGGNPGNITDFVQTFAIPAGQDGRNLRPEDLIAGAINKADGKERADILGDQERHSVFVTASQELTDWLDVFAEGRYSERDFRQKFAANNITFFVPSSNPFFVDPFGGSEGVFVQYSFLDDLGNSVRSGNVRAYGATTGSTIDLPGSWAGELSGSYSRERTPKRDDGGVVNQVALGEAVADPDPQTAFNPFGDGSNTNPQTIERIKGFQQSLQAFELWSLNARFDGTLFSLPGGAVKLAVGGEYREESLESDFTDFTITAEPDVNPTTLQDRNVFAGFAEVLVPLIGESNRLPGVERLEVSVAGRVEDYSDFGSSVDPKVGVNWVPLPGLKFRGTWGTSFKAPILVDLNENFDRTVADFILPDPQSPTGSTAVVLLVGNNAALKAEEGENWTVGLNFNPEALPKLNVSATYYDIRIKSRIIGALNELFTILEEEDRFAPRITRNPDLATVQALFNDPDFRSFFGLSPEDIRAVIDLRLRNVGELKTDGLDLRATYAFETAVGQFEFGLNGTYIFNFEQAETQTAPLFNLVNTVRNPVDLRVRGSASWNYRGFGVATFLNYVDGYRDDESTPERGIDSWTTVDLSLSYDTKERVRGGWLQDLTVSLSAQNLFDTDPPFANNNDGLGYDPENAYPLGRFIALQVIKAW
ncbi:MAG: TonB-dependent receptor domain-containing protein [Steroidobacteraceae bacterium]